MTSPVRPRPPRRAVAQLWLGLLPLLAVGMAVMLVLGVRLSEVNAPLADATEAAAARVVEAGHAPDGRGVLVAFVDAAGQPRSGLLVLADQVAVTPGTKVLVRYGPAQTGASPDPVYAAGDATTRAGQDIAGGMVIIAGLLVGAVVLTLVMVLSRRRLRRRARSTATATRLVVRRGLLVRSWLELDTSRGPRWVPVFWIPELATLAPDTRIDVHGDAAGDRLVLPVVHGAEVWPSGRVRARPPRGAQRTPRPQTPAPRIGMARQARVDAVVVGAAPLLGLLWAYVDRSGASGFAVATALAAVVSFWAFQVLGSDPQATARG
jgi:hypothetical protein